MKSKKTLISSATIPSHPARGAWIEIYPDEVLTATMLWSHPARGAWIEIVTSSAVMSRRMSHPARGAWIEMLPIVRTAAVLGVAPRKGCVD